MEDDFTRMNIHGYIQASSSEIDQLLQTIDTMNMNTNTHNDDFDIDTLINATQSFSDFILEQYLEQPASASDDSMQPSMNYPNATDSQGSISQDDISQLLLSPAFEGSMFPPSSVPVGSSPSEGQLDDYTNIVNQIVLQQQQLHTQALKSKKRSKAVYHPSTTVGPVEINQSNSGSCRPCSTAQLQNDAAYWQQQWQYDATDPKKIQVKCQPRPKFRPRTQNERKNGSHYLRCNEGVYPEYPTIFTNEKWAMQSAENYIEVQLVGLDKLPHPYAIDNKTRHLPLNSPDSQPLIIKQDEAGPLYFRLTLEDFHQGYKSFQIELIKSRQDDIITKDLIRQRQLDQSMLRFTRVYLDENGHHLRDECTETFSEVMSEAYGDVAVEHAGPQLGSMGGGEMMYIVLKGRILKMELQIVITEPNLGWRFAVPDFTKNGNVIHFRMPPFPVPEVLRAKCNVILLYKQDELDRLDYAYEATIDQMMSELNLGQPNVAPMSDNLNAFDFLTATNAATMINSIRKTSTAKPKKRLTDTKRKN